ncbi:MAG: ROK family protein [Solirubrobacterales bacterium]
MATTAARGGIDLGGTKIQAAVVDGRNKVIGESRRPTPHEGGPKDVADAMTEALLASATAAGIEPGELRGVGVGSPGAVDEATGRVSSAKNLPGWGGSYALGPRLSEAIGTDVRLGNDVQVAVNGEFSLGAGREFKSLLGVWWGTGVGGGIILNGKPWLGRGAAAEIGHIVVKRGGRRCPCGRRGCMEAYAGRAAMENRARKLVDEGRNTNLFELMESRGRDRLTSGVWERALDHGDELTEELLDEAVEAIGTGVASALNVLDVEAVVIGGGLGDRFGKRFGKQIEKQMMKSLFTSADPPAFRLAALGDLGGAIGASLLVKGRR